MKKSFEDTFALNNGVEIPCIGYGTFQAEGVEAEHAVQAALKAGYRLIDTAAFYGNEQEIGNALQKSDVDRKELFVTSKVWNTDRGYEKTKASFAKTMDDLKLDYLDLFLIHWPANRKQFGDQATRINAETWKALEELYDEGKIRAIGLSNFMPHHIEELMKTAKTKPMVDQIEFHPGWAQIETAAYCQKNDIVVEAWSPLGRREVLDNRVLGAIADQYGKSVSQLCIRWVLQHGLLPLPKAQNPAHIVDNMKVFDFMINDEDMKTIDALKNIGGECAVPDEVDF